MAQIVLSFVCVGVVVGLQSGPSSSKQKQVDGSISKALASDSSLNKLLHHPLRVLEVLLFTLHSAAHPLMRNIGCTAMSSRMQLGMEVNRPLRRMVVRRLGLHEVQIEIAGADKPFRKLVRPASEILGRSLQRISGIKGRPDEKFLASQVQLRRSDASILNLDAIAVDAWAQAAEVRIGKEQLPVLFEPPEVVRLEVMCAAVVGVPITPFLRVQNCSIQEVQIEWECLDSSTAAWRKVGEGLAFTPVPSLEGRTLRVVAIPPVQDNHQLLAVSFVIGMVEKSLVRPILKSRLSLLETSTQDSVNPESLRASARGFEFRFMTYNLLANCYRRWWDSSDSVHSYCNPALTLASVRLPRLLSEILAAKPDVACLQEMDASWVDSFWKPQLAVAGYDISFAVKGVGKSSEGIAVIWRRSEFKLLRERVIRLNLEEPMVELENYLIVNSETAEAVRKLPTIGLIISLQHRRQLKGDGTEVLIVANTHLYYANPAPHVRLMQSASLIKHIEYESNVCQNLSPAIGVVMAGDFNADAKSGALELLLEQRVSASHRDWCIGHLHWAPSLGLAVDASAAARHISEAAQDLATPVIPKSSFRNTSTYDFDDLRKVALAFHRLRKAIQLLSSDHYQSSTRADGPELTAKASHAAAHGHTLLSNPYLAAYELAQQIGARPTFPVLPGDMAAARDRLEWFADKLREQGVGLPVPGASIKQSDNTLPRCGADINHSIQLQSAYGIHHHPTHMVKYYADALDWILYSPSTLRVLGNAPLPSIDDLKRETALPSSEFPSDHVSLITDFTFSVT